VPDVSRSKALRHEHFDVLADDIIVRVAKKSRNLPIREPDNS
jgi:hypothetical protein